MRKKYTLPDKAPEVLWHSLTVDATLAALKTTQQGLTSDEAIKRIAIYGENKLQEQKQCSHWKRFFVQFNNILICLLLLAVVITILLRHWIDSAVILGVVILNTLIGFIQEGKAEKALKSIQYLLSQKTTVIRAGRRLSMDSKLLVPGDIVLLQSGDKAPADLRLFNVKSLQMQESILTGESAPVSKSSEPVVSVASLADRTSMVYSGTLVTYGRAEGIVVATGQQTEIGRINRLLSRVHAIKTPLLRQVTVFGRWLTAVILTASAVTFVFGWFVWGDTSVSLFLAVVSLAVAAIPEGLPAVMTITLAIGVIRMAKRNAIIRRLPAVEAIGSITTICTDKTGTLTHNELAVRRIIVAEHDYHVTGSGCNERETLQLDGALLPLEIDPNLYQVIRSSILCNDAELLQENNAWTLQGNPLDGAFLVLALKFKMDILFEKKACLMTDFIPFESQHKMMASLHHDHEGHGYIFVKGAPERILDRCSLERFQCADRPLQRQYWENKIHLLAEQGQRLVAVAVKHTRAEHHELTFGDIETGLILLGIVGLTDPPREEAIQAIADCQAANIRVKMITGDHVITARAIAKQIGIKNFQEVMTGEKLDQLDDATLAKIATQIDVYARTSPTHKLRLVQALQKNGEIVAMTGDGVNDSPALKQADVGIAMGKKGSEAAREVADIVLVDDNFASIVYAIEEGRAIYDNFKKTLLFVLPTNGGEAFIIVIAIIFGYLLPITAVQILWLNMVTAVTFALSLAFEPPEENIIYRSPCLPQAPILSKRLVWRIFFVLSLMTFAGFIIFLYERSIHNNIMVARCAVVNMLVAAECAYLFNCRKLHTHFTWRIKTLLSNKVLLIAIVIVAIFQLGFTYLPKMDHFFGVSPIGLGAWMRIILLALLIYFATRVEQMFISGRK